MAKRARGPENCTRDDDGTQSSRSTDSRERSNRTELFLSRSNNQPKNKVNKRLAFTKRDVNVELKKRDVNVELS